MEIKDINQNHINKEKLIALNKTLEELEARTLMQRKNIEALLNSSNNLETNEFELELYISLHSSKVSVEDNPFYENKCFESFLDIFDKNLKGYYILEKEFPNESFVLL